MRSYVKQPSHRGILSSPTKQDGHKQHACEPTQAANYCPVGVVSERLFDDDFTGKGYASKGIEGDSSNKCGNRPSQKDYG